MMAKAKYRPAAPGDGMGNISLSEEELKDHDRLLREAVHYANRFHEEEDTLKFHIGITNYSTNRAFVFAIEAARLLAGSGDATALRMLKMAIKEIEDVRGDELVDA
jgi:hypothetical protein